MFQFSKYVAHFKMKTFYVGTTIDLHPDFQSAENASPTFLFWINNRAIPWLRQHVIDTQKPERQSNEVVSFNEFLYELRASTKGEQGFIHIQAVEKRVRISKTKNKRIFTVDRTKFHVPFGKKLLPCGTEGKTTRHGTGIIVGYYADDKNQLSYYVKLYKLDKSIIIVSLDDFIPDKFFTLNPVKVLEFQRQ